MTEAMVDALTGSEVASLRHELRTPINQIVGYCEMLIEDADDPDLAHRRVPLGEALHAVREAISLIDEGLPPTAITLDRDRIRMLYELLQVPQARIVDAMSELLKHQKTPAANEFIADVCRIRDAAERLLPTDRPRAEATGRFSLPAAVTVEMMVPLGSRQTRGGRILVVDDVEENRGVLQRRLEREGHTVVSAASGAEALKLIAATAFDMVLLDVMMPDMDGYEALQRLKSSDATRDVPVIMISALNDIASIVRCIASGAEDYLPKPFDPVLLRARISACLEKKDARQRERQFLSDVAVVSAAAVAVERGLYAAGALAGVSRRGDELGALARVFDNMVSSIHEREERLHAQIEQLRMEAAGISDVVSGTNDESYDGLVPNALIAGRYQVLRMIGEGGMGRVYLAEDRELRERVAIKTLRPELLTSDETAIERFRNEIRLARRIAHRNIVRTHDFGKDGEMYFVTMEYVEGTTLRAVLDQRGHLAVPATLAIARQAAAALASAHQEGIIHRDIKPQNLLVDVAGMLKVMDFGVARLAQRTSALTQAGMIIGTPTYMAPEQLLDENVDARSDLYSLGVLLYECVTGKAPYEAKSPVALIAKILQGKPQLPSALMPAIPESVSALIMQLLQHDPEKRHASAQSLGEVLAVLA